MSRDRGRRTVRPSLPIPIYHIRGSAPCTRDRSNVVPPRRHTAARTWQRPTNFYHFPISILLFSFNSTIFSCPRLTFERDSCSVAIRIQLHWLKRTNEQISGPFRNFDCRKVPGSGKEINSRRMRIFIFHKTKLTIYRIRMYWETRSCFTLHQDYLCLGNFIVFVRNYVLNLLTAKKTVNMSEDDMK